MNKKLSAPIFILSNFLILLLGLTFLGGLHYVLNIQYQRPEGLFSPTRGPITSQPASLILTLQQPEDESLVFQGSILVTGKTAPNSEVLVFTQNFDQVVTSKSDGAFSTTVDLEPGVNNIKAIVFDATGDERAAERTVYFSKEKL